LEFDSGFDSRGSIRGSIQGFDPWHPGWYSLMQADAACYRPVPVVTNVAPYVV